MGSVIPQLLSESGKPKYWNSFCENFLFLKTGKWLRSCLLVWVLFCLGLSLNWIWSFISKYIWDKNERDFEKLISSFNEKIFMKKIKYLYLKNIQKDSIMPLPCFLSYVAFWSCAVIRLKNCVMSHYIPKCFGGGNHYHQWSPPPRTKTPLLYCLSIVHTQSGSLRVPIKTELAEHRDVALRKLSSKVEIRI
jgi:hypothetical protein